MPGFAEGVHKLAFAFENMRVQDGQVQWLNGVPVIIFEGASSASASSGSGGDSLPEGGEQYQVLQRDGDGEAVWYWVRAAPDPA